MVECVLCLCACEVSLRKIQASRWAHNDCCSHQSGTVLPSMRVAFAKTFFFVTYGGTLCWNARPNKSAVFCFGMCGERCDWACYNGVMGRRETQFWHLVSSAWWKFALKIIWDCSLPVNAQEMRKKKITFGTRFAHPGFQNVCAGTHTLGNHPFLSQGRRVPHLRLATATLAQWSLQPLTLPCRLLIM